MGEQGEAEVSCCWVPRAWGVLSTIEIPAEFFNENGTNGLISKGSFLSGLCSGGNTVSQGRWVCSVINILYLEQENKNVH